MAVAPQNQIRAVYEKNLKMLAPWIQDSLEKIDEEELWREIEVTYNAQGYPVCRYHHGDESFQVTSERPVQEAEEWWKTIAERGSGAIFLYGCGFGYSLLEIFARKKSNTIVILFEENLYLFKAMLYYFDLTPVLETRKIIIFIGDSKYFAEAFDQLFRSIVFYNCTCPTLAFTPLARRNFKEQYLQIHKYVFSRLSLFTFYTGNDHLDNLIGFQNILENVEEIVRNPYLSCMENQYRNVPAFIIANGPSLDKNIQQLKKIQGKGLIISVESAIVPLIKNHITPDILTIIERTPETYTYHFENTDYPEDIALLCLALVDKRVYPSFLGPKIPLFRRGEAVNEWVNQSLGDGSALDAGANVSHLAAELAVYLGANPVVFVGQDYAYGAEGVTHSKDAAYNEEKGKKAKEIIQAMPVIYVEGNDGTMVPSNRLWADFKLGLEMKIAAHPDTRFLNATEGGARIEGTECMPLSRVIQDYCLQSIPFRVNEFVSENKGKVSLSERKERLIDFIGSVEKHAESYRNLVHQAMMAKFDCKRMVRLAEKEDTQNRSILEQTYQKNVELYQLFLSDAMYRCFLQQMFFVYYYIISQLGAFDTPEKVTEIFKIQYNFFSHIGVVCQSVSVHLENAAEKLKNVLRKLESEQEEGAK
ncbi:motility associated factor glycosyltransferase family protein [Caproiciproducens faecalis]|uniref:Motility associated factor glycosyltransferase family protein n=1 Tax=Caproiciproducens faecalis TaxID=2820301 RepID=A0ABS7DML6_9FIRM|nr:6-hydroxymethylpterin diphosphokinase MptE-like protein [Caproiciproducens faecalis]MBW7572346.1 motility associated factor glycosyltransferase family protein [Caproiciproducens faecalis]